MIFVEFGDVTVSLGVIVGWQGSRIRVVEGSTARWVETGMSSREIGERIVQALDAAQRKRSQILQAVPIPTVDG